jgi:pimeloyl-ACP methyl ester carboxylesterase
MPRLLVALALVAALAAGCSHHHAATPVAAAPQLSGVHACPKLKQVTCATLSVPLDYSGKVAGRLSLHVVSSGREHPAKGVIVVLTGGPGESGVPFLPRFRQQLGAALEGYRLVMLDQRGTGSTALNCPALQRAAGASDLAVPPASAVRSCAATLGERRRFYTTRDSVADLDRLRAALGVRQLTLDGVSYGTYVAEHYALEHPGSVRALVLDSVVPQEGIQPFQLDTIHAIPRVLGSACRAQHCGSDPVGDLAAVVRARHDGPELLDTLVSLSVGAPAYRPVAAALSAARAGRPAALDRLVAAVHRADRVPAGFLSQGLHASTLCEDYPQLWGGPGTPIAPRGPAVERAAAHLTASDLYPFDLATATGNGELLTCKAWPPIAIDLPPAGATAASLPAVPVLMLAGDRDLSTPLAWAQAEARHAPKGRLVVVTGAGHSVQTRAQNPAGRDAVIRFLQG